MPKKPSSKTSNIYTGKLPLHIQVSEMLAREIQAGHLPAGSKLAPEREMALQLNISIGTLRKALADLTQKKLLQRVQGSGNYVQNSTGNTTLYGFFRLELIAGGGLPQAKILSVEKKAKQQDLPEFGTSNHGFRIRRLRQLNNINAALEEIWLDASFAKSLNASDLSDSLYQYYRQELGLTITHVTDAVSVASRPSWAPKDFASSQTAWGYVERLSYDQSNHSVEYSRTWFDPQTTRYMARLR